MSEPGFDAIVLAGGRGSRLGGVDKAGLEVAGARLVDRAVLAARAGGARRVIVSGPAHAGALADRTVREEPPFSGPLAALAAGLPETAAPWLLLLACDLVHPSVTVGRLKTVLRDLAATESSASSDGAVLVDSSGHPQWLSACVRASSLRSAVASVLDAGGSLADRPVRSVLGRLALRRIPAEDALVADIDTPEQLADARSASGKDAR